MDDGHSDQNGRRLLRPPIDFRLTLFTRTLFGFIFFLFALIL